MLNRIRSFADALLRRQRFEDAMAEEVRYHMETYADDLTAQGLPRPEAERLARVEFGGVERVKEECRHARGLRWMDELRQDVRYGLRTMQKAPAFTIAAVVSIALGIGANTAIFTLMEAVLIRSMPIKDPAELFFIGHDPGPNPSMSSSNYPMFERYRDAGIFSGVTAYDMRTQGFRVVTGDDAETVDGQFVSGNYHALVGVPFVLGRGFSAEQDRTSSPDLVAVISDHFWTRRFGRSPDVLGKTLTIRERQFTIVGVTAPAFYSLDPGVRADVTVPISIKALDEKEFLDNHNSFTSLRIVGRLRKGASERQALAAADTVFRQFMSEPEQQWVGPSSKSFRAASLMPASRGSNDLRRLYATPLNVLMGMVALVLLIGCANVANLLLARATARTKEVAVRLGVGAGRARLVRQFLTESLLVAFAGGALGFVLAFVSVRAIVSLFNVGPISVLLDVNPNTTVLAFTTLVSVATGVAFGLVPALRATRIDVSPALKANGGAAALAGRWTTGKTLLAVQLATCVVVIAAAGLLVRTLQNLKGLDTGFQKANILLFDVDTSAVGFPAAQRPAFWTQLLERVRARQGVVSASLSRRSPIDFSVEVRRIEVPGFQSTEINGISTNVVTPEYFTTFGIGLLRGRGFTAQDHAQAPKVALVSAGMARFFFGESDPLGRTFLLGGGRLRDTWTIVGIVEDVRQERLRDAAPTRMVYTPLAQGSRGFDSRSDVLSRLTVEIRAAGDADRLAAMAASVREDVRAASKDAVLSYIRTMDEQIDAALIKENVLATLSTAFGLLALLLSAVGLYGVMSYAVARRTHEIGIRLALGAARSTVLWQTLRDTLSVAATGIAPGIGGALLLAKSVKALLFGLEPRDPLTLTVSAAILFVTAAFAGYLPARKASAVDPMRALRTE